VRLVKFAEPNGYIAANDDWTITSLDDNHLRPLSVPRRGNKPYPGKQFKLAFDRYILHTGGINPLANRIIILTTSVVEFTVLDVERLASEEVVATTVIEVEVCVDDDINACEVKVLLIQWKEAGFHISHCWV
jgi:hypothetical protein